MKKLLKEKNVFVVVCSKLFYKFKCICKQNVSCNYNLFMEIIFQSLTFFYVYVIIQSIHNYIICNNLQQ